MSTEFPLKRRQVFLTETQFRAFDKYLDGSGTHWSTNLVGIGETDLERASLSRFTSADHRVRRFILHYTAGAPPDALRKNLSEVVEALESYQRALAAFEGIPQIAPLSFEELADYERALQLVSLCYLLHRRDLLPRLRALLDPAYAGEDTIYEDLMAFDVEGRVDLDEWYHAEPYNELVNAMYLDASDNATALNTYCNTWYKAFEYVPWHNSHLRIEGTEGDYFGYWAFEAGAVAFLYDIDDREIDHMVYPRDLVEWARANRALSEEDAHGRVSLRCDSGQPCPQTGYWRTPAQLDSRRHFTAGDVMPSLGGDYGATIWQWDDNQQV